MSTSGDTTFQLVTNDLIAEAFDICGIGSEGEAITADQYARAKRSLNTLVKAWGTSDHLWLRTGATKALVASTASYALTPKPGRVLDVRRRNVSNVDTMMTEWSRAEYLEMPSKTTAGVPVNWYYDPQLATGTLYVWPVPTTADAAAFTLYYTYTRRIEDFDGSSDDPDLPQEWLLALSYGLADQLALKYGIASNLAGEIARRAAVYKAQIESWDTETASVFIRPAWRSGYRW